MRGQNVETKYEVSGGRYLYGGDRPHSSNDRDQLAHRFMPTSADDSFSAKLSSTTGHIARSSTLIGPCLPGGRR